MKKKSVLLSVCLLITLAITKLAYDAKVRPRGQSAESPPAPTTPLKLSARADKSPPPKPIPGITMYDRIEDAPAWTIRYGQEFWRSPHTNNAPNTNGVQIDNSNFNLNDVVERVSHAIRRDDELHNPTLKALQYTAIFDDAGFSMVPHKFIREDIMESRLVDGRDGASSRSRSIPIYEPDPSSTVQFQTVSVRNGNSALYERGDELPSSFLGNTAQRLLNSEAGLVEHYQAGAEGVEVTWQVNSRPESLGALEIRAELDGLAHHGVDAEGHLFADASGTPRITVSHATVVDSAGKRLEIPLAFSDGHLSVTVPELALAELTFPIAIDPIISPIISPGIGGGLPMVSDGQHEPAVSWNAGAGAYLVVWQDRRGSTPQIYGTRVLDSGRILDLAGFSISDVNGPESLYPRVASNGAEWVVVWRYSQSPPENYDIWAARVDGTTVTRFSVCANTSVQEFPDIASVNSEFFLSWLDSRHPGQDAIYGARLVLSGGTQSVQPGDGAAIALSGSLYFDPQVRLAGNGTKYLVVWSVSTGAAHAVYGATVSAGQQLWQVTATPLLSTSGVSAGAPAVAGPGDSGSWFVVWEQPRTDCSGGGLAAVYGTKVNSLGNPVAGSTISISNEPECHTAVRPAIASNGNGYLVLWHREHGFNYAATGKYHVHGARLAANGTLVDTTPLRVSHTALNKLDAAIASNGSDYFAVWAQGPTPELDENGDIFGARIAANATGNNVLDNIPLSTLSPHGDQYNIALPRDNRGTTVLVVWEDKRAGNWDIYGARVSPNDFVDVNGFEITGGSGNQIRPAVSTTSNETGWMVAWEDSQNIYAKHIPANAAQPFPASITVCADVTAQEFPSIAAAGDTHFVVWRDNRNAFYTGWDAYGAVLTYSNTAWQAGTVTGIAVASGDQNPSVGSTGNGTSARYMVVWEQIVSGNYDIWGQVRMPNGTGANYPLSICANSYTQGYPSVAGAADGSGFGVVWHDNRNGNDNIYALHVTTAGILGTPSGGRQVSTAPAGDHFPEITASPMANQGYFVAWRYGITATSYDVYGARLVLQVTDLLPVDPSEVLPINVDLLEHGSEGVAVATVYPAGATPVHWVGYSARLLSTSRLRISYIQY